MTLKLRAAWRARRARREVVEERAQLGVPRLGIVTTQFDEPRRELTVEQDIREQIGFTRPLPFADTANDLADHARRARRELGRTRESGRHHTDVLRRPNVDDPQLLQAA